MTTPADLLYVYVERSGWADDPRGGRPLRWGKEPVLSAEGCGFLLGDPHVGGNGAARVDFRFCVPHSDDPEAVRDMFRCDIEVPQITASGFPFQVQIIGYCANIYATDDALVSDLISRSDVKPGLFRFTVSTRQREV